MSLVILAEGFLTEQRRNTAGLLGKVRLTSGVIPPIIATPTAVSPLDDGMFGNVDPKHGRKSSLKPQHEPASIRYVKATMFIPVFCSHQ